LYQVELAGEMFTRMGLRAEGIIRALELPPTFCFDRHLTKSVDYVVKEIIVRKSGGSGGSKYQKVSKSQVEINSDGIDKLARISHKCNVTCVSDFMATSVMPLPVVYLFAVVNDDILPDVQARDSDKVLVKYGYTNNLARRTKEHIKTYGPGIILKYHIFIDPNYLRDAENDVREFFRGAGWHLDHPGYSELALVPRDQLNGLVATEYSRIGESYLNKVTSLSSSCIHLSRELEFARQLVAEKERSLNLALGMLKKEM